MKKEAKKIEFDPSEVQIDIRDTPLSISLGNVCQNVSWAYRIMEAIHEGRYDEAFEIANKIFKLNDAIIDEQVDRDEVLKIIDQDRLSKN